MKKIIVLILIAMFVSASSWAIDKKTIDGADAVEIYNTLVKKLGTDDLREGHSPEAGCYHNRSTWLLGMRCQSTMCFDEESYSQELIQHAACSFEHVKSQEDLQKIRKILEVVGLSASNLIFQDE